MIKNIIKIIYVIAIIFYVNSCDILRLSPFEVTSWTPGGGYHSEAEKIIVCANFSTDPDRASVERYFSLTGDGNRVKGVFQWEGKKMTFIPLTPLEVNTDYSINISADAHDVKGVSMDIAFESRFSTRPGTERPVLVSYYPEMYTQVGDIRAEVQLRFSLPVVIKTLYENVSFSPSMTGSWRLEEDGYLAVFSPAEQWMHNNRYELRVSSSLTDSKNTNTGKDFTSIFSIGEDLEAPYLLYANRIDKNGDITQLDPDTSGFIGAPNLPVENEGWEKDDKISFVFSKPVDSLSVKNYLNVEDASGLVMENFSGFENEFIFYFESIPVYESRFTIRLKPGVKDSAGNESKTEYVYRIFANGKFSKPPQLVGIRMPMAPDSDIDKELISFGIDSLFEYISMTDENYPSAVQTETWIELYFDTAEGAKIDLFSIMEYFRIDTSNNVLTFSSRQIKTDNFSTDEPQQGWENYYRLEIKGFLTNSVNFGIVNFQIAPGLRDSLSNKNEKLFRISVVK